MSEEPTPDLVAALDQAMRAFKDIAKLVRNYYVGLLEHGFTADQALALALGFQGSLMTQLAGLGEQ